MAQRPQFQMPTPAMGSMTVILIIAFLAGFVLGWLPTIGQTLFEIMAILPGGFRPWTWVTFPFIGEGAGGALFFFLLMLMWWYWVGTSLEDTTGRWGLLGNFAAFSALTGVLVWLSGLAQLGDTVIAGPYLPIAALTAVWCGRSPKATIRMWGIIPITGQWLAVITGALVVFGYGTGNPLFGVIMGLPVLLGWFYGQGKLPVTLGRSVVETTYTKKKENREFDEYYKKVKDKEKEREERERLRKLFEDSLED